jgi:hypothetical protein
VRVLKLYVRNWGQKRQSSRCGGYFAINVCFLSIVGILHFVASEASIPPRIHFVSSASQYSKRVKIYDFAINIECHRPIGQLFFLCCRQRGQSSIKIYDRVIFDPRCYNGHRGYACDAEKPIESRWIGSIHTPRYINHAVGRRYSSVLYPKLSLRSLSFFASNVPIGIAYCEFIGKDICPKLPLLLVSEVSGLLSEDKSGIDSSASSDQRETARRRENLYSYCFPFGASALVGFALLLVGAYRRCDGVAMLLLICGWAALVTGLAGIVAGESIYGGKRPGLSLETELLRSLLLPSVP